MKATDLKSLSTKEIIEKVGAICNSDMKKTGVLASVTLAQFILESGWGKSELAQKANNCFGMKKNLSGNTWKGSSWDGESVYRKKTTEYDKNNKPYIITAEFRKYPSIEKSIADHSAYLLGAMNGNKKRYAGLKGETNYKKAIKIIRSGGYATSQSYVDMVVGLIKKYKLTKYDKVKKKGSGKMKFNVHAGHTKQSGKSPGAGSKKTKVYESVEDRKIAKELIRILRKRGHKVYNCTSEGNSMRDNLSRIVKKCNKHKVDLDISVHLNSYNGSAHGTETLIYSSGSKAKKYAEKTDKKLAALGFTDRGVKVRSDLYVLHWTESPAMLIETFFCDSEKDCKIYKKVGYKGIAKAIADAVAPVGTPYPTVDLKEGDSGEQVKRLQRCLNKIMKAGLDVDGHFGPKTAKAVIKFKNKYVYKPSTSSVGAKTRAKIKELMK